MHDHPIHGWRTRGYLPHMDHAGAIQHVIFGLADSLPQETDDGTEEEPVRRFDSLMDRGVGTCLLADARCASIVQDELQRLDGQRYRLLAWCIMPNHVHVVIEQARDLSGTVRRWKTWTAREINTVLERSGAVWLREYFDRYARNDKHLQTMIDYVENNPVRAGLVAEPKDWRWSSAGAPSFAGQGPDAP